MSIQKGVEPIMQKVKNIEKDSRAYTLSHEGFLLIQALAKKHGVAPSAYLEFVAREAAQDELTDAERQRIKEEAERIAERRREAAMAKAS
jgi:hypothetical protein